MMTSGRSGFAISSDGVRIFFRLDGAADAPVIVFSNSLGTTHEMWDAQAAAFARDHRVVRYDSRGHGRSDAPSGPYAIDRLADDVIDVLDHLGLERAVFCGLSLGGMVGQSLGARHPGRIGRLVLANTAPALGPPESWDARMALARSSGMRALRETIIERWFTPEFRQAQPAEVGRIGAMFEASDVAGYVASCAAIRSMDQRERLAAIGVPVLVIVGTRDPATPPEQGEFIAAHVAGARIVALEAAHLSNIERAPEFNAALRAFALSGEPQRSR